MSDRPEMEPFYKIKAALEKATKAEGLYLENMAIIPNEDGPDFIQAMFVVGDRAYNQEEELDDESKKIKDEFDLLISMDDDLAGPKSGLDIRRDSAEEDLRSWLDED